MLLGHRYRPLIILAVAFLYLSGVPFAAYAFTNTQAAAQVLGQSSFTSNDPANTVSGEAAPSAIAFDSSGDLWVADTFNARVSEYTPPFTEGEAASLVLGQASLGVSGCNNGGLSAASLCDPFGLAFDSSGNLWVADAVNNRVLEYVKGSGFATGQAAALVLGQPDFTHSEWNQCDCVSDTASTFNNPWGIAFDSSGNLWVADAGNNRVLEFVKGAGFSTDQAAALVIGQPDFTHSERNQCDCGTPSATSLSGPYDVAFGSSGNLWVADDQNARVLEYQKGAGFTDEEAATLVIGQSSFTTGSSNGGDGISASVLGEASYLAFDSSGNLWVSDGFGFSSGDSRVLEYSPGFSTGEAASLVLGQQDFTHGEWNQCDCDSPTGSTLDAPAGLAFDSSGNLWVADAGNNRVLEFQGTPPTPTSLPPVIPKTLSFIRTSGSGGPLTGKLVGLYGPGIVYNIPGYVPTPGVSLYAISFCYMASENAIQISGFSNYQVGFNSTEVSVSNWASVLTSAQGWPSEPACTS